MAQAISENTDQLIRAIDQRTPVHLGKDDQWSKAPRSAFNWLSHTVIPLVSRKNPVLHSVAQHLLKKLDTLETAAVPRRAKLLENELPGTIKIADAVLKRLNIKKSDKTLHDKLQRRVLALKYRVGAANHGLDKQIYKVDEGTYQALKNELAKWKKNQVFAAEKPGVSFDDLSGIFELCTYKDFAKFILKNPKLLEQCFKWRFRDKNPIKVFVEYCAVTENLEKTLLNKCVSRLGHAALKVQYQPIPDGSDSLKTVTLPFEGREISIINPNDSVTFKKGNWTIQIKEIYRHFVNQNKQYPNFTYFTKTGIENWKAARYSFWDYTLNKEIPIDLSKPNWWLQLPRMEISKEEAQKRFKDPLNKNQPVVALCATRETRTQDGGGTHGYTEIALPTKNNTYLLYTFGKFAIIEEWPAEKGFWKIINRLTFAAKMVRAIIPYPDANIHYTQRQFARLSVVFDPKLTHAVEGYLSSFNIEIARSLQGNLSFQLGGDNCSKAVQVKFENYFKGIAIPDAFKLKFEDAQSPFKGIARVLKWGTTRSGFIKRMQWAFRLLAPGRGFYAVENGQKVWKSLDTSECWKNWEVYHPPKLFEGQEQGKIPHVVHVN